MNAINISILRMTAAHINWTGSTAAISKQFEEDPSRWAKMMPTCAWHAKQGGPSPWR